jgi:hypothetical protein
MRTPLLAYFLPLGFQFFTESKINRLYRLGKVHSMISHCLTAMVGFYFFVKFTQKPKRITDSTKITHDTLVLEREYSELL